MNKLNKTELLSPAGSFDALKQAIHNGTDAIYLGGTQFGARAFASNFNNDELKEAVEYAHLYSVKIYVTVNTLIYENEIKPFKDYIKFLVSLGVDALIMQDIGMAYWVINTFDIPVHSSTQMHNYSESNVEYLKANGYNRAVLARESNLGNIHTMSQIMDTEVFAHGALCICYSGQCLFSAIEHNRSGNRGKCAQACRMKYSLYSNDNLLLEDKYLLSPKDLGLLNDVDALIKDNVSSIKLEGRMKSPQYVGFVTKTYRNIINNYYSGNPSKISSKDNDTLERLFNRGFTKGYIFGLNNTTLMTLDRPNHAGVHVGEVVSTSRDYITILLNDTLHQGDGIKFDKIDKGFVCNKIYYKGKLVSKGKAGQTIQLDNKLNLNSTDRILLTKDVKLLKSLERYKEKKIPVSITGEFYIDQPCKITLNDNLGIKSFHKGVVVEESKNAPTSKNDLIKSLSKLGDTPYITTNVTIDKDDNIFISKSNINKLRRDAVECLNIRRLNINKYNEKDYKIDYNAPLPHPVSINCTVSNELQLKKVLEYNMGKIYARDYNLYNKYKEKSINVYYFMNAISENRFDFKDERLVIRDTGGIKYAKNNTVVSDYMLNVTNSHSLAHLHLNNLEAACLSVELDNNNINNLINNYNQSFGNLPNVELLVYGRIQLMVMKHCILGGHIACKECKSKKICIKDIKGNDFPVLTDDKCNNYIYSKDNINRINKIPYLKSIGVNGFRVDFINETANEVVSILNNLSKINL